VSCALNDGPRRYSDIMGLTEYRAAGVRAAGLTVAELDELHDARDIALCEAVKARGEASVPHDVFMASIEP
jgi:hypothetical protein